MLQRTKWWLLHAASHFSAPSLRRGAGCRRLVVRAKGSGASGISGGRGTAVVPAAAAAVLHTLQLACQSEDHQ